MSGFADASLHQPLPAITTPDPRHDDRLTGGRSLGAPRDSLQLGAINQPPIGGRDDEVDEYSTTEMSNRATPLSRLCAHGPSKAVHEHRKVVTGTILPSGLPCQMHTIADPSGRAC